LGICFFARRRFEILNAARMSAAATGLTVAILYFSAGKMQSNRRSGHQTIRSPWVSAFLLSLTLQQFSHSRK